MLEPMRAKLYAVPASHPCAAVEAALRIKGIDYERVDLLPVVHAAHQRVVFGRRTVPGLKLDGRKIVGTRAIMRALEAARPEPPLLPADHGVLARVEAAETWGDEILQPLARRLVWAALKRRTAAMRSYAADATLPIPLGLAMTSAALVTRAEWRLNDVSDEATQADLRALPEYLDRVDGLIAEGTIGGAQPNVADLQIGSSVRILMTLGDLEPLLAGRACTEHALRLFPRFAGHAPAGTLPAGWLPAAAATA